MHSEAEWSKKRSSCYFGTGCDSQKSMPASAKLLMHAFRKLVILLGFWVLTIWVWSAGLSAAPLEFNLAPNPSFEHGGPRNRLLYKRTVDVFDWIPYWEVGEYFWAERGRTGKRSLGISRTVKEDGTWAQGGWVNDYHFPAFDGVWYQFSAWVKTTKAQGHTHLVIAWFGPKGWIKNTDNGFFLAGTSDWVQISVADIPPKGASYGRIYLRSDANPGEALFDDVKLTLANDTEAPIIVPNSSFEVVAEGMPSAWEIWPPTVRSGVGENPQLSRTGRCFAYITDATQRASWQSQPFYLDACWTYTYEASVYANMDEAQSGQVRIGIEWLSSDRVISVSMSEPVQAGHKGWVKLLCKAEPPTGALRGRILLLAEWVKGTVRFDDVTLTIRKANAQREETSAERKLPLSVMIAQCYTTLSRYLAPDRLKERWETTFPDQGTVAALTREIEDYIKTNKEVDNELRRFLGMAHYHLGNYKTSLDYLRPLYRAYDNLDVLNDAVRHYMKWAEIGLGGKEIEAGIPNVVQPSEMKGVGGKDKTMAVIYMNDDEQTGGDWVGRYGRYAYHLCSMRQYHIVGGLGWPLSIRLYTTNPAEMGRRCIIQMDTDDTIALFNPHSRRRSIAYLDDRGEVYVGAGPDIICELVVPSGFFIISFYAREHRITALDEKGAVLDEAPRRKDHRNAYRRFFVRGPLKVRFWLHRDDSLCTVLSGIFLDRLEPNNWMDRLKTLIPSTNFDSSLIRQGVSTSMQRLFDAAHTDIAQYARLLQTCGELALKDLEAALRKSPNESAHLWYLWWMLNLCVDLGQHLKAEECAIKLAKLLIEKNSFSELKSVLEELRARGLRLMALRMAEIWFQQKPYSKDAPNEIELAQECMGLLRDQEAILWWEKALAKEQEQEKKAYALFMAGILKAHHRKSSDANSLFTQIIKQFPNTNFGFLSRDWCEKIEKMQKMFQTR